MLPQRFISSQYAYKIELLWLLHKAKASIAEYPIAFVDRKQGYSKLPSNSIFDSVYVLARLRIKDLKQYLKMCMVGASGFVLQLLVYNALRVTLTPFGAAQLAIATAMLSNFVLNQRFTFKSYSSTRMSKTIKSMSLFIGYSILMILFQSYWLKLGVKLFGSGVRIENEILILGMLIGSIFNYQVYSRLIWSSWRLSNKNINALEGINN